MSWWNKTHKYELIMKEDDRDDWNLLLYNHES